MGISLELCFDNQLSHNKLIGGGYIELRSGGIPLSQLTNMYKVTKMKFSDQQHCHLFPLSDLTRLTNLTSLTNLINLTNLYNLTNLTSLTRYASVGLFGRGGFRGGRGGFRGGRRFSY